MNKTLLALVTAIAHEVREWLEILAEADGYREGYDMMGYCAIASAELHRKLELAGIESEMHLARGNWASHVFVVVEDHIVDVTATQFDELHDKVTILHLKEGDHKYYWQTHKAFKTPKKLANFQQRAGWPEWQVAQ